MLSTGLWNHERWVIPPFASTLRLHSGRTVPYKIPLDHPLAKGEDKKSEPKRDRGIKAFVVSTSTMLSTGLWNHERWVIPPFARTLRLHSGRTVTHKIPLDHPLEKGEDKKSEPSRSFRYAKDLRGSGFFRYQKNLRMSPNLNIPQDGAIANILFRKDWRIEGVEKILLRQPGAVPPTIKIPPRGNRRGNKKSEPKRGRGSGGTPQNIFSPTGGTKGGIRSI